MSMTFKIVFISVTFPGLENKIVNIHGCGKPVSIMFKLQCTCDRWIETMFWFLKILSSLHKVPYQDCWSPACRIACSNPSSSYCVCSCIACRCMWQMYLGTWIHIAGVNTREREASVLKQASAKYRTYQLRENDRWFAGRVCITWVVGHWRLMRTVGLAHCKILK